MTHLTMEALLSLREGGAAEPGDATARAHLESCDGCRLELERLHQRVARLKALPALRPTRDRWPGTAARIREDRRRRRVRISGLIGLAAAASIALGVTSSILGPTSDTASGVAIQRQGDGKIVVAGTARGVDDPIGLRRGALQQGRQPRRQIRQRRHGLHALPLRIGRGLGRGDPARRQDRGGGDLPGLHGR